MQGVMHTHRHVQCHTSIRSALFIQTSFLYRNWSSHEIATIYLSSNYKNPYKEMKMKIILDLIFQFYVLIMRYRVRIRQTGRLTDRWSYFGLYWMESSTLSKPRLTIYYFVRQFTDDELECSAEEVKVKLEELENEKVCSQSVNLSKSPLRPCWL